jgi:restriction endonuclease S subunit
LKNKLEHIAKLSSGIYIKPDLEGSIYYLQAKHVDANGNFDFSFEPEVKWDNKITKHLLHPGDVLLACKGSYNFAVHYKGIINNAIASSTFIVIRIADQDSLLPKFLCWYLNHPQTQLFFKDQARGTDILSLTIGAIKEMDIFIPPVKKQKLILDLDRNRKKEKELKHRIETLREQQVQQQLLQSIKMP